jgi:hypothetical protein
VSQGREVGREIGFVDLHALFLLETLPGGEDLGMVVPVVENPDAAGQVEDSPAATGVQKGALGAVHQILAEAESVSPLPPRSSCA